MDSDDHWYSNRLQSVYDFLQNDENYDVICTDELIINNIVKIKKIWRYGPFERNFYARLLKHGNCISTSASIVNKEFLKKNKIYFDENRNFVTAEDYDFFMKIASINGNFKFIHKVLGEHLFHLESTSFINTSHKKNIEAVLKHHVFNLQKFTNYKDHLWKFVKSRLNINSAIELINSRKYVKGIFLFLNCFFQHPIKTINQIIFKVINKIKK